MGFMLYSYYDDVHVHCIVQDYITDVNQAIDTHTLVYEEAISLDGKGIKLCK